MSSMTDHGIIYANADPSNRKSSIIFHNKFILAPGTILTKITSTKVRKNIHSHLLTHKLIDSSANSKWKEIRNETYSVIHEDKRKQLQKSSATIAFIFNCKNISESIDSLLDGFQPDLNDGSITHSHDYDDNLAKVLISCFVILKLGSDTSAAEIPYHIVNWIGSVTTAATAVPINNRQNEHSTLAFRRINKLDKIASVSTPFANESFFKTINIGHIANIFGIQNCLLIATVPLVYGCEGGGVYNSNELSIYQPAEFLKVNKKNIF